MNSNFSKILSKFFVQFFVRILSNMFHVDYKPITNELPPSILERAYNQLLSQKRNPISPDQIIEKHDQIENHLRNALEVYEKYKARNRKKPTINEQSKVNYRDIITQNSDPVDSKSHECNSPLWACSAIESTPPSHSLNSKPDYSHCVTVSGNLSSRIYKPTINEQSEVNCQDMEQLLDTKSYTSQNKSPSITYTEEEFNTRLKEETDALRLRFTKASKQRILEINNAIARKNSVLGIETIKSWIRDGSIYLYIHDLEMEDGKGYSDRKNREA